MADVTGIYLDHFGLNQRPFALVPNASFIYWSEAHRQAFSILEYGILSCVPITVITGEIGAGKTTLLRELLSRIEADATIGLISNAQGDRGELLHWVLMALNQPISNEKNYVQQFHQLQEFLITEYAAGRRTVLIFDEAQNLSLESLEELRMFSNINADEDELLQIILVGQPNLYEKLSRPELEQFTQRIGAEYHLPTLTPSEVEGYIAHRLSIAGCDHQIFSQAACESIHLATKGTPRVTTGSAITRCSMRLPWIWTPWMQPSCNKLSLTKKCSAFPARRLRRRLRRRHLVSVPSLPQLRVNRRWTCVKRPGKINNGFSPTFTRNLPLA
ncbi:MAG: AAA family ATPase [Pseudomonadota bacterium]